MRDLLGAAINGVIPFVVPALLVVSWMVNHKTTKPTGAGESRNIGKSQAAPVTSSSPAKTMKPAEPQVEMSDGISDSNMTI